MSDKPAHELSMEDISKVLNESKNKAKTLIMKNLNAIVCLLIVVAMAMYKFSDMSFTADENPLLTITDALIVYVMAMVVYANMHWQYQRKAAEGKKYLDAKRRHAQIVGSLDNAQVLDGLDDFCRDYPLEELKNYRTLLLQSVGQSYERFEGTKATDNTEAVKGFKDMTQKEIKTLKLTKKQKKAVMIAIRAKPRKLSFDQLIGGRDSKRDLNFIRAGKKQATMRDTSMRMVRYLALAFGVSWYTRKLILSFSWEGVTDFLTGLALLAGTGLSGAHGGTDAINEHEVNRIHDQCDILAIYCARKGVKIMDIKAEP